MSAFNFNATPTHVRLSTQTDSLYNGFDSGSSLFLLTSLIAATIYLSSKVFYRRPLTDDKGNTIPDGPTGLPILGVYFTFDNVYTLHSKRAPRLISIPNGLPRIDARLLGQEIRIIIFHLARKPALCHCLGSTNCEGLDGHERRDLFFAEGDVSQIPNYLCRSWDHSYALQR